MHDCVVLSLHVHVHVIYICLYTLQASFPGHTGGLGTRICTCACFGLVVQAVAGCGMGRVFPPPRLTRMYVPLGDHVTPSCPQVLEKTSDDRDALNSVSQDPPHTHTHGLAHPKAPPNLCGASACIHAWTWLTYVCTCTCIYYVIRFPHHCLSPSHLQSIGCMLALYSSMESVVASALQKGNSQLKNISVLNLYMYMYVEC